MNFLHTTIIQINEKNMSSEARRIFAITKLTQNYEIHETLEDAINSFN